MDTRCQFLWLGKTRKLLWLVGISFFVVMAFQSSELSYNDIISSLIKASKAQVVQKNCSEALSSEKSIQKVQKANATMPAMNTTSWEKDAVPAPGQLQSNISSSGVISSAKQRRKGKRNIGNKKRPKKKSAPKKKPAPDVLSLSEMYQMYLQSRSSNSSKKPKWSSAADQELVNVRSHIENPPILKNDSELYWPLYRNVSQFKRSYELMEKTLKVFIYKEGEKPVFHKPRLNGIYCSEGWFMKHLEASKQFITNDWRKAHLFYFPLSSQLLVEKAYKPDSHSFDDILAYLRKYFDMITTKYQFWNRTEGTDHFLVACHDWAPYETKQFMGNSIRVLCNSDINEGFVFGKDIGLPETFVRDAKRPLSDIGGKSASKRSILSFFAGNMHGHVRPILLKHWENKDPDMKIFAQLPNIKGKMNYVQYMKSSKYCICPRGYEVNSPRVVEAIFFDCVPVIISDNFVPPFFEILDWETFAIFVAEKDIPNLKDILFAIPEKKYRRMQRRVKMTQKHFLWHEKPVKYDLFHMILHSVWFNRVFLARLS